MSALTVSIVSIVALGGLQRHEPRGGALTTATVRPLEGNHVAANLSCCHDLHVPNWVAHAADSARNQDNTPCKCPSPALAAKAIQPKEPNTAGNAIPIPRVPYDIRLADFFWHFAYRGLPVILTGTETAE